MLYSIRNVDRFFETLPLMELSFPPVTEKPSAPPRNGPHGVQVVNTGPDHTFSLDEDVLKELLLQDDIKDRPVVVLSVAGAFRKGKSFLLDFFLRYLNNKVRFRFVCTTYRC